MGNGPELVFVKHRFGVFKIDLIPRNPSSPRCWNDCRNHTILHVIRVEDTDMVPDVELWHLANNMGVI